MGKNENVERKKRGCECGKGKEKNGEMRLNGGERRGAIVLDILCSGKFALVVK